MPAISENVAVVAVPLATAETVEQTHRPEDPDAVIIARFLSGESSAFETLFQRYRDYVYNIAFQMVGNPEDASDLTQDTFMRVWRALPHFQGNAQFSTWLYRIAVNACISELRKRPKTPPVSIEDEENLAPLHGTEEQKSAEQNFMRRLAQEKVREIVSTLPTDYRTVIVLRHFQDLSYQEIAGVMGCTVGAIKIKLHRARKLFRSRFVASQEVETR